MGRGEVEPGEGTEPGETVGRIPRCYEERGAAGQAGRWSGSQHQTLPGLGGDADSQEEVTSRGKHQANLLGLATLRWSREGLSSVPPRPGWPRRLTQPWGDAQARQ